MRQSVADDIGRDTLQSLLGTRKKSFKVEIFLKDNVTTCLVQDMGWTVGTDQQ
jgi:hypothetical protein